MAKAKVKSKSSAAAPAREDTGVLIAYEIGEARSELRPAPFERVWMDATDQRYAYRCLPLNIANAHGWEVLTPTGFTAAWSGLPGLDGVLVGPDPGTHAPALSHFGNGVLTFHLNFIFRTAPGFDLLVTGPFNAPKDGIAPLSGIIETDWAPYTFTMNWKFTRPNRPIRFEAGEPFCHLFPIRRGELEALTPEIRALETEPALKAQYETWSKNRNSFNDDLKKPDSTARAERWQKNYYKGLDSTGREASIEDHRTRVRLKPFTRR